MCMCVAGTESRALCVLYIGLIFTQEKLSISFSVLGCLCKILHLGGGGGTAILTWEPHMGFQKPLKVHETVG